MEFRKNPISLARVKIARRVLATIIGVHGAFLTRASLSPRWVMAKRDNEFEKKKKKKKKLPITRLSGLEIFRSIDGGIKIKGGGEGNRKADTGAFFIFRFVFLFFFFCNLRERTFFRIRKWFDGIAPILWIKLPVRDTNWTVNWNTLVSKRSSFLPFNFRFNFKIFEDIFFFFRRVFLFG